MGLAEARATAGSPLIPAAQTQALSTIQGDRLSAGNPYFASMMANAARPVVSEFNTAIRDIGSRTAGAGRYGSGAMGEMESQASENLANALSSRGSELAYQNYASERARQDQAVGNAASYSRTRLFRHSATNECRSRMQEGYDTTALNADIGRFEFGQNAPLQKLAILFISSLWSTSTS